MFHGKHLESYLNSFTKTTSFNVTRYEDLLEKRAAFLNLSMIKTFEIEKDIDLLRFFLWNTTIQNGTRELLLTFINYAKFVLAIFIIAFVIKRGKDSFFVK